MYPAAQRFVDMMEAEANECEQLARDIEEDGDIKQDDFAPYIAHLKRRARDARERIEEIGGDPAFK